MWQRLNSIKRVTKPIIWHMVVLLLISFSVNISIRYYINNSIEFQKEEIELVYDSHLNLMPIEELLTQNRERDRMLQRTSKGIHRDDLQFSMHQFQFKTIASQGQKKSLLFAMKLAEYEIIKTTKGFYPILLLDDFFEKLDETRMNNLLKIVCIENRGQVFITDTHKSRLLDVFEKMQIKGQIIEL